MKINVGCGYRTIAGYTNCDINPNLPNIDLVCSLEKIPIEDSTYEEVFASHCIEHVPFSKAKECLREWLRVLKPGGVAVIDTPNIDRNIRRYIDGTWLGDFNSLTEAEKQKCSFDGKPNKTLWINFKIFSSDVQWDLHYANYDPELLPAFCLEAGFAKAEVVQTEPSLIVKAYKA